MKKFYKILNYIPLSLNIILICVMLLYISSLIPSKYLKKNVESSAETLVEQSNIYLLHVRGLYLPLDNYTDALMINTAYSIDSEDPSNSFLLARKNYIKGVTEYPYRDFTGELKSWYKYQELNQVGDLMDTVNGEVRESFEYARYWHGYLIFLRPLLLLFDIAKIRVFNIILFILLGIVFLYLVYKKIGLFESIVMLISLLGIDYLYIGLSLQNTPVFLVMMLSSIFILLRHKKIKDIYMLFYIIGSICSFVDFFTVPIITLGVPATVYFLLDEKYSKTLKDTIKTVGFICLNWLLGYIIMWLAKWVIVDLICNRTVLETSINQLFYRMGIHFTTNIFESFYENLKLVFNSLICSTILGILFIIVKRKYIKVDFIKILPYLFICILPFVWYSFLEAHSYTHNAFTFRNMILVLICIPIICKKLIKK